MVVQILIVYLRIVSFVCMILGGGGCTLYITFMQSGIYGKFSFIKIYTANCFAKLSCIVFVCYCRYSLIHSHVKVIE